MVVRQGYYQTAYEYTGTASAPNSYLRSYINTVWQPWTQVVFNEKEQIIKVKSSLIDRDGNPPTSVNQFSDGCRFQISDKDNESLGWIDGFHKTDGSTGIRILAAGEDGNGTTKYNGIELQIDSEGKPAYALSNPYRFASALNIGTIYWDTSSSISIPASWGTYYDTGCSLTLPAGVYIIMGVFKLTGVGGSTGSSSSGLIITNSSNTQLNTNAAIVEHGNNAGNLRPNIVTCEEFSTQTTIKLRASVSVARTECNGELRAIRIK